MSSFAEDCRVAIIGAGVGGLSSAIALAKQGFTCTVLEAASSIGEVGAGINVSPNVARVLDQWDLLDYATKEATLLKGVQVLDAASDEILSKVDYSYIKEEFGYPFIVLHRKDLQKTLLEGVRRQGDRIKIQVGQRVTEHQFEGTPRIKVESRDGSSSWQEYDLIIGADGVKSKARGSMLAKEGQVDSVVDTAQAAYRILVHRDQIKEDPELIPFFTDNTSYRWIAPGRHIIAYPICGGTVFNMSTAHPDIHFAEGDNWTASGSRAEMLETFEMYNPRVQKLLHLVPDADVLEWKLRVHHPLPSWVEGNLCLVGDACHPTLPHLAQGAALAIEDGAVLGVVMSKVRSKEEINKALRVYQALRKSRADWAVETAAANGKQMHLKDKAAQDARNEAFRKAKATGGANPDKAVDKTTQSTLYAHDCIKNAEEKYDELFASM